jgi:copper chaperone CopZ
MKKSVLSFCIFLLFGTLTFQTLAATQIKIVPTSSNDLLHRLLNISTAESVTLTFKITGMKSEQDARTIDEILSKTSIVISSSTDFKSGICKVETEKITNKESIIEIICHKAANRLGYTLTAVYVEK